MNITFLIGNGFDLRLGMKTRFKDMYADYIVEPSSSEAIADFKRALKTDAPNYETWGDFEMAMAQKAKEFEDEIAFIECLRDFKVHMAKHLEREQRQFKQRWAVSLEAKKLCADEVLKSVQDFYKGLSPNVKNRFVELGAQDNPQYNFIIFNYTDVFDDLLGPGFPFGGIELIHIHGTLDADVVLGADNLGQITGLPYKTTRKFERAFIKPEFNKIYDAARLAKAEMLIENSDVICIYGMSLGMSDHSWNIKIKNWLLSDPNNHLVYFVHDETIFNKLNWDAIFDEEEERIAKLLGKICNSADEMDKIFNQIHIPVGYDIFGVDAILEYEKIKAEENRKKKEALRKRLSERPIENGV